MVPKPLSPEDSQRIKSFEMVIYTLLKDTDNDGCSPEDMLERCVKRGETTVVIEDIWKTLDKGLLSSYVARVSRFQWKLIKV